MKAWRYTLWSVTLVIITWAICLISAVVGGKGVDKMRDKL